MMQPNHTGFRFLQGLPSHLYTLPAKRKNQHTTFNSCFPYAPWCFFRWFEGLGFNVKALGKWSPTLLQPWLLYYF